MAESKKVSEQTTKLNWKQNVVMYLHDLVYLLMGLMIVFLVMFRLIVVSGDSMYSTLVDGDYLLLLSNVFYQEPAHGDIIVISKQNFDNGAPIVKRVIASEGQIVDIDFERGIVYVDGLPLEEDYINSPTTVYEGVNFPVIVEEGCFFVLGDNRGVSKDSRSPEIGFVDRREILGKAIFLLLPGTNHGMSAQEFDRIGVIK
jgi:signal peptidase I